MPCDAPVMIATLVLAAVVSLMLSTMARQPPAPPRPAFSLLVGRTSHCAAIALWSSGNCAFVNVEAEPAVRRVTTQLGMTVKRPYAARRITLLAVAAMAAVAAITVLSATAQNQTSPPRRQLRVERTALQVSAAGASATAFAITPNGRTAYVVTAGTVTPVNLATGKPGRPIMVGDSASVIAISPNGRTAYLPNHGVSGNGDTVSTIRLAVGKPGGRIKVGADPDTMAITPNGRTAYVGNYLGNSLTPITLATNKPGSPIKLGFEPWNLAITPNGRTAYVVNNNADTVIPVTLATGKLGRPIKVGERAVAIAITPNGRTAYVVNNVGNSVTPITLATGEPGHPIKAGRSPNKIVITPNGKTAYVIDSRGPSDNVTPINLVTNKPEPRLEVSKANAIAIAPIGSNRMGSLGHRHQACADQNRVTATTADRRVSLPTPCKP